MLAQPCRKGVGLAVRQKVHDLVALEVNEHGAVAMAAAPSPVIHRKHARGGQVGAATGLAHQHAPQRVGAGRHGKPLGQPRAGPAAERLAEVMLQSAEPAGAPHPGGGHISQPFGEGLPWAGRVMTAEPARLDAQHHRAALPGQVAQGPLVAAVELARHRAAIGTGGRRGQRLGEDGDAFGCGQDLHNGQARRDQGQEALGQRELSKRDGFPSCAHPNPQ